MIEQPWSRSFYISPQTRVERDRLDVAEDGTESLELKSKENKTFRMNMDMQKVDTVEHGNMHIKRLVNGYKTQSRHGLHGPNTVLSAGTLSVMYEQNRPSGKESDSKTAENLEQIREKNLASAKSELPSASALFFERDTTCNGLSRTDLGDEQIACFDIGGEPRLCLPQIFKMLRSFTEDQLIRATRELNILVVSCTAEELEQMKTARYLPAFVKSFGLVTKSNAERLINKLMTSGKNDFSALRFSNDSFKVYHECFGSCHGLLDPVLYVREDSLCVRCTECGRLFAPEDFVCHSHSSREDRISHWGFDRKNWRHYLLCAADQENLITITKKLEEIKSRFVKDARKNPVSETK